MKDKNELAKKVAIYVEYQERNPSNKSWLRGNQEDRSLATCKNFLKNFAKVNANHNAGWHMIDDDGKLNSAYNALCGDKLLIQKINDLAKKYQKIFDKVKSLNMRDFAIQVAKNTSVNANLAKNNSVNAKETEIRNDCTAICDSKPWDKSANDICKFLYNELPMFLLSKQYSSNFKKLLAEMQLLDDEDNSSENSCTIS